jgi:hypothetical protein
MLSRSSFCTRQQLMQASIWCIIACNPRLHCSSSVVELQDLYPAWIEQGLEWIAVNGQQAADTNQAPAVPAAPLPQDLMLSPEQLQLVTDYFQKVC